MNDPNMIQLKNVRLSFADIFTAKAVNGGEPRFSANFLLDKVKDRQQIDLITSKINALIKEKLDGRKLAPDKVCLRDGDEKEFDGFQGCYYVSAANKKRPNVVDRDPTVPLTAEDGRPYSGCYVNAVVRLWAQDNQFGRRVNASLEAIQFVRDGEAFGASRPAVTEMFDTVDVDDEESFV